MKKIILIVSIIFLSVIGKAQCVYTYTSDTTSISIGSPILDTMYHVPVSFGVIIQNEPYGLSKRNLITVNIPLALTGNQQLAFIDQQILLYIQKNYPPVKSASVK